MTGPPADLPVVDIEAHHLWPELGRPGWDRFGLTVTAERQWVWLDSPDSAHAWRLSHLL
jgi:hypothetical protein